MIATIHVPRPGRVATGLLLAAVVGCGGDRPPAELAAMRAEEEAGSASATEMPRADGRPDRGRAGVRGPGPGEALAAEPLRIPAGTAIHSRLERTVSSRTPVRRELFTASVIDEILADDGMVLVPEGARIWGRVDWDDEGRPTRLVLEGVGFEGEHIAMKGVAMVLEDPTAVEPVPTSALPAGTTVFLRLDAPVVLGAP